MTKLHPRHAEAEALAASLPPLLVEAERLAAAVALGVHGRRKAGMGESFWQFRHFRQEDTRSAIDWRQSAKSHHLFVREREWEAAQSVWFWRDGSPSMRFASGKVSKIERANLLTLALASLLVRGGERIALLGENEAPSSSRGALHRMGHRLLERLPHDAALPAETPRTRNAQLVWYSDFLSDPETLASTMQRFSRAGVQGHLVQIIDPAEDEFPYAGRARFEMTGSVQSHLLGRAESVATAYRARFKAHGEALEALAARFGWSMLAHRTDRSPQAALIALHAGLSGDASA